MANIPLTSESYDPLRIIPSSTLDRLWLLEHVKRINSEAWAKEKPARREELGMALCAFELGFSVEPAWEAERAKPGPAPRMLFGCIQPF